MKTHFEKELERVYLVFDSDIVQTDEYLLQMPLRCSLPSLLPLSIISRDNRSLLRADVTACTSLASRFQKVPLTGARIRGILHTIRGLTLRLPKYLLDPRDLYLDPEAVFLGAGQDELLLCYVPHLSDSEPHSIRFLAEFFLKKIDHSDTVAAGISYQLFDEVSSDSYVLGEVLSRLLDCSLQQNAGAHDPSSFIGTGHSAFISSSHRQSASLAEGDGAQLQAAPRTTNNDVQRQTTPRTVNSDVYQQAASRMANSGAQRHSSSQACRSYSRNHRRRRRAGHTRRNAGNPLPPKKDLLKHFLPYLLICGGAVLAILIFRLDLTQIGGMGFLCAALIWMVHNAREKHRSDIKNVWADEDDPGDDQFYQQLLREVYAEDPSIRQSPDLFQPRNPPPAANSRPVSDTLRSPAPSAPASTGPAMPGSPGSITSGGIDSFAQNSSDPALPEGNDPTAQKSAQYPILISLQKDLCPNLVLGSDHILLGKSRKSADAVLPDHAVSRIHARIEQRTDGYYITDLFSTNGTALNGKKLEPGQAYLLRNGAVLTFAALRYQVFLPAA